MLTWGGSQGALLLWLFSLATSPDPSPFSHMAQSAPEASEWGPSLSPSSLHALHPNPIQDTSPALKMGPHFLWRETQDSSLRAILRERHKGAYGPAPNKSHFPQGVSLGQMQGQNPLFPICQGGLCASHEPKMEPGAGQSS